MVTEADLYALEQKVHKLEEKFDKLIDQWKECVDHMAGIGDMIELRKPHIYGDTYEIKKFVIKDITKG